MLYNMKVTVELQDNKKFFNKAGKSETGENFFNFVKKIVKSEVKIVFRALADEGVRAGKKDIDRSKRK